MTDADSLPWFRMYSDIVEDDRMMLLAFEDQRHYVWLLCLKNKGMLDKAYGSEKLRERIIAKKLGLDVETLLDMKSRLVDIGLIDETFQPTGWEKKQYLSDCSTARVRRYRERQSTRSTEFDLTAPKSESIGKSNAKDGETFQKRFSNGDVTAPDNRIQITEKDKNNIGRSGDRPSPFDRFYAAYPKHRKRKTAENIWARKKLDSRLDMILEDIAQRLALDRRWKDGYIPDPPTYLTQERWNDELETGQEASDARGTALERFDRQRAAGNLG